MNRFTLAKQNGQKVSCVSEIPDNPAGICIAIHGFTSSKESPTVQMLLHRLPAAGIGVIGIDLPAHGTEESSLEELRIESCKDSIAAAEEYAAQLCPDASLFYFGSSFGAYCTALYISTRPHRGRRAFFRSAAVNMPSLFILNEDNEKYQEYMADLEEKGYIQPSLDLGSPVKVTRAMLDDLAQNDLFAIFDRNNCGEHKIAMAHGAEDAVIDPEQARRFARTFQIPVTFFEGEGHSLSDHAATPDKVADLAVSLFLS